MFYKYCVILLMVLASSTMTYGQKLREKNKELFIGLSIEPVMGYRHLSFTKGNEYIGEIRNRNEVPAFGWRTALNFRKTRGSRFAYEYGFSYVNFGYRTKPEHLNYIGNSGNFPKSSRTSFRFRSVGIPITGNYSLKLGNVNGYATLGIAGHLILSKVTTISADFSDAGKIENRNVETLGYRGLNLDMIAGFGIKHNLNKKILVELGPQFQRSITSVILDKNAREFPYTFGFQVNAMYKLK